MANGLHLIKLEYATWVQPECLIGCDRAAQRWKTKEKHETSSDKLTWVQPSHADVCLFLPFFKKKFFHFHFCGFSEVVERHVPRKTVSLVVALVSPTLLEATHSYMASSRGVRKGWILSTEPEPSSNSITCRCERQDNVKGVFLVYNKWGTFHWENKNGHKKNQNK